MELLHTFFGIGIEGNEMAIPQMAARGAFVYFALIAVMRLGKKRFLGDATVFDAVLSVMIGSIGGRIVTGGAPLLPGLASITVFVFLHWICSWLGVRSPTFASLIKGTSDPIVKNGKVNREEMRRAHMGDDDLKQDLRNEGVSDSRDVKEARLERSGKLSVIKK